MSYWKSAGLSFNKYTAIAARTARRALKEDKRIAAEKRDFLDVRATKWTQGNVKSVTHLGTGQDLTEDKILLDKGWGVQMQQPGEKSNPESCCCPEDIRLIPGDAVGPHEQFQDVSEKFRRLVRDLPRGELVKSPAFHAYDFVSAVQMGDRSMDSGQIYMQYLERDMQGLKEGGHRDPVLNFDITQDLTWSQILTHMDFLLSCQASWHSGASLSQTILSSGYAWHILQSFQPPNNLESCVEFGSSSSSISNTILRPYIFGVIKACDLARNVVATGICLDEEDLITNDYGFEMLTGDDLTQSVIEVLVNGLESLKKYTPSPVLEAIEHHLNLQIILVQISSIGPLEHCGLKNLRPRIECGIKYLEQLSTNPRDGAPIIPGCISRIFQSKLGGEGPPRPLISIPIKEALSKWSTIFNQLLQVSLTVEWWSHSCNETVIPVDWVTKRAKVTTMGPTTQKEVVKPRFGALVEYLSQITFSLIVAESERYPFVFGCIGGTLFGVSGVGFTRSLASTTPQQQEQEISNPVIWVCDEEFISIQELIKNDMEFQCMMSGDKRIEQEFLNEACKGAMHMMFDLLSNRCRQYGNLGHCLVEFDSLHVMAQENDEAGLKISSAALPSSHWVYVYKLEIMIKVALLGFPLDLYQVQEYGVMYNYVVYVYNEYITYLTRTIELIGGANTITKRDSILAYLNKRLSIGGMESDMAQGMALVFSQLMQVGVIANNHGNNNNNNNQQLWFKLRMKPFSSVGCPQVPTLAQLTITTQPQPQPQKILDRVIKLAASNNNQPLKRSATYARLASCLVSSCSSSSSTTTTTMSLINGANDYTINLFFPAVCIKRD